MSHKSLKLAFCLLFLLCSLSNSEAQNHKRTNHHLRKQSTIHSVTIKDTCGMAAANTWADKKMKHLSLDEKVAQLMFVRVPQTMNKKQQHEFEKNFTKRGVGGVCFFKGTAATQLELTKRYQNLSDIPLLITIDGEWGLGMRLTDCYSFPRQMLMGALSYSNDTLISLFGYEVGQQCHKMGITINFAPVCDINNNPQNPVIGYRSFGENKKRVARKSSLYAKALQDAGVIAVGKHFPGHGDTDVDSHLDIPVISHTKAYIDSVDLFPFKHLVNTGIRGIMIGHLQVNAYDNRPNMPSSLSERIVKPLLRDEMKFDGLVFTDGIDMKAVSNNYENGEGAIRAIRAGADVILLPIDVEKTIDAVVNEAKRNPDFEKIINDRCHRILREKYRCGLNELNLENLSTPTKADEQRCQNITRKMASKALTLVHNEDYALPLAKNKNFVSVSINGNNPTTKLDAQLIARIRQSGTVVMSLYANLSSTSNFGVSKESLNLINNIAGLDSIKSVLIIYGSPYILESFQITNATKLPSAIVVAYQNMPEIIDAVPAALYGESSFEGKLPVSVGCYPEGTSLKATPRPKPTYYDALKQAGMNVACFHKIDTIALNGIKQKAYPGCQILVAKDGKVVYNRCYGRQTYDDNAPLMDTNTVYDLASLTKVTATNLAVMKLVDAGKISLDDKLSRYLPYLKHTNKKNITVKQALSHFARLKAFDAYWKGSTEDGSLYVGDNPPEGVTAIGENIYIKNSYRKNLLVQIAGSKLEKQQKYLYSDLGFILLADLVQHVSGQSIDIFTQQQFYEPLNMKNTCYQPLQHGIKIDRIAPTEYDKSFRNQQLRGYVHDPNAAAMGGIAGHAGLFSTANDLFRIYQMMLDSGRYDSHQYISAKTFNTFNSRHFADKGNRRALGFDKPFINGRSTNVAPQASQSSFGHTGFTGIMVWVDPQYNLIYIFLSNRVYPSASPNKLSSMNIRTDIQELIYKSIGVK